MDFEMMLISFLPHKYFSQFLKQEKPKFQPYMQMIHLVRLYSDENQALSTTEAEITEITGVSANNPNNGSTTNKQLAKLVKLRSKHKEKA